MTGLSHAVIGGSVAASVASIAGAEPALLVASIATGTVASLVPDIDTERSVASNFIKGRSFVYYSNKTFSRRQRSRLPEAFVYLAMVIVEVLIGLVLYSVASSIRLFVGHRGITHSLLLPAILLAILPLFSMLTNIPLVIALSFMVGYTSHILADSATVSGVGLFNPISSKKFHLLPLGLRIRTGKDPKEAMAVIITVFISILVVLATSTKT